MNKHTPESKALWGGRFEGSLHPEVFAFNQSVAVDRRLWKADLHGTLAHARELARLGVLNSKDFLGLSQVLEAWIADAEQGKLHPLFESGEWASFEDVHSVLETALCRALGDVGKRVHTGRSRNDQVATAFRLTLRWEVRSIQKALARLTSSLLKLAERSGDSILPGYTHLQRGQPVLFSHWCHAYIEMCLRDLERLEGLLPRLNRLPLGSAALAGSPYAIDRAAVARELGFEEPCKNSLDAVSDRDFCMEVASACSIGMVHLSRLSEDLILYCSREFGFLQMSDVVSTGSSLMPQKKNPDVPELIRGKSASVFGQLQTLLVMSKGLPLAYNKDLQEDKAATFAATDTFGQCLGVMSVFLDNLTIEKAAMRAAASSGYLNATDLADYLVGLGIAFRDAHEMSGVLVRRAMTKGVELGDLSLEDFRAVSPLVGETVYAALSLESSVSRKKTLGSTHPEMVAQALKAACSQLAKWEERINL